MRRLLTLTLILCSCSLVRGDVGDPQLKTDHPWYPGELACSTFDRLFATQAAVYHRVTGRSVVSDEDKVLASWLWRNTHYAHGEEGGQDLWGAGPSRGMDTREREYWTGLFAHGFGLCGTTHSQWVGEMEALLGHGRGRSVGTAGHNSFEVFVTGGAYGNGRWVLLDHDLSTVVFTPSGDRLMGLAEIVPNWKQHTSRTYSPTRQRGWLPCGLHAGDASSFSAYGVAEYLSGYSGPPPIVQLRRGETLRRDFKPGLHDSKTFVFWGHNYNTAGIPGPERSRSWVNQPDAMFNSKTGTAHVDGQVRYANAVYTYQPNFATEDYREGIVSEDESQVTFSFASPYIIAATPPNDKPWGIYDRGCRNGLTVSATSVAKVSVSVDRGQTWHDGGTLEKSVDLTDHVKGHRQYWLRIGASARDLRASQLTIVTVCQCNTAVLPRLSDNGSKVTFEASQRAIESAGPNKLQATAHLVGGKWDSPNVTLELATPNRRPIQSLHAAAHVKSSTPPDASIRYQIEYSLDAGTTWRPVVKDWTINRQGDEPKDFWSQSLCWGETKLTEQADRVRVRFRNNGGKAYARAELHLVYQTKPADTTRVTFGWHDAAGAHTYTHNVGSRGEWTVPTGRNTTTDFVEFSVVR